jgi:hypothetical protein
MQVHALSSQISSRSGVVKEAQEFCREEEKVREFGVTSHMPALESEVEQACGEEDPASDEQTSKYE